MHKLLKHLLVLLLAAGAAGFLAYHYYQQKQTQAQFYARPAVKLAKDGTNINPVWQSAAAYRHRLHKKYPDLYVAAFKTPKSSPIGFNAVVPGLSRTKSLDLTSGKVKSGSAMTPQGLVAAGPYLLISAYDGRHQQASVIYCLDKQTGSYLKTIQVPGKPHLGGLAYDPVGKNIWLTGENSSGSALMAIPLAAIRKHQGEKTIAYQQVINLPTLERASTVTYFDNQLFVGFFNTYDRGKVAAYPLARSGTFKNSIASDRIKSVTGQATWSMGAGSTTMDRQIQGIAFYHDLILLSQSYGSQDSKLYIFPVSAINNLDEKNAQKVISFPPYLEQVAVQNGQLLCLFESGSKLYARKEIMVMDRILSVNIMALLGEQGDQNE